MLNTKRLTLNLMKPTGQRGIILIIDDEDDASRLLRYNLKTEGFEVQINSSVKEIDMRELEHMRMVIVNGMNHEITGLDLINIMKSNPRLEKIPIILCAYSEGEEFIVNAFDLGFDDFVSKPYSQREMLARINAVLRRYPEVERPRPKVIEGITIKRLNMHIDTTNHKVVLSGATLPLTKTEYSIFEYLVKNANNFYTRDQIFGEIWKDDSSVNVRIVDTNISRLRKKLGDASKSLINRYGMGYAFMDHVS